MLIISTGEFRGHQKAYLDKVDAGIELIIHRKNRSYKVTPVEEQDDDDSWYDRTKFTKEEFFARIEKSRNSPTAVMLKTKEDIDAYFDKMAL